MLHLFDIRTTNLHHIREFLMKIFTKVFILWKMFGPMSKPNIVLFLCTENKFLFYSRNNIILGCILFKWTTESTCNNRKIRKLHLQTYYQGLYGS
jgi:hypothetical protein